MVAVIDVVKGTASIGSAVTPHAISRSGTFFDSSSKYFAGEANW